MGVVQRPEEELPLALGAQQIEAVPAEARAQFVGRGVYHLVAVVAVDSLGRHASDLGQVVLQLGVLKGRGVAGSAYGRPEWMLGAHVPGGAGPAVPVGPLQQIM